MKFDPDEVLNHVKALSSPPHRTGSFGEVQAQYYIIQRFKAMGMESREEEFSFTPVLGLLTEGFLLMVLLLLTALHFLFPFNPLLGIRALTFFSPNKGSLYIWNRNREVPEEVVV